MPNGRKKSGAQNDLDALAPGHHLQGLAKIFKPDLVGDELQDIALHTGSTFIISDQVVSL